MPAKIVHLDVSEPIPSIWGTERYDELVILTRHHGRVLGTVWVPNGDHAPMVPASRIREQILHDQNWTLSDLLIKDRLAPDLPPSVARPAISVVIASAGRPELLAWCLDG